MQKNYHLFFEKPTPKSFAIFPVRDLIATLTTHIPNKGEQLARSYGYYSNVSRGKRKKVEGEGAGRF